MEITKAVIPAAGLGTRFLPYTKGVPKEMIAILNKPALHHIVEECMRSSLKEVILVTNPSKTSIVDYFSTGDTTVASLLKGTPKEWLLAELQQIVDSMLFTYIHQHEPRGLGHAVLTARDLLIQEDYFCTLLPDDLMISTIPGILQLMHLAHKEQATIVAVQEVPNETISSYGVVAIKEEIVQNLFDISDIIEKPARAHAPSNLAVIGRYVLSRHIFTALDEVSAWHTSGEIQLTDALAHMLNKNQRVLAYKIQGDRYDVGTPLDWIKCTVSLALQDPQLAVHLRPFLQTLAMHSNAQQHPTELPPPLVF